MFMHVGGMGDENKLSTAIGKVFAALKETSTQVPREFLSIDPAKSSLDTAKIDSIMNAKGPSYTVCLCFFFRRSNCMKHAQKEDIVDYFQSASNY